MPNFSPPQRNPRILVTDAWFPQVNGVVHTWNYVRDECERLGQRVHVIEPSGSRGIRAPGEPDLLLSTEPRAHVMRGLRAALGGNADALPATLHIATEGPLGWAARNLAVVRGWPFTTSYHTRFPEYLHARFRVPAALTYAIVRRFHAPSHAVLVATAAMRDALAVKGFAKLQVWSRGVDAKRFSPQPFPHQRRAPNLPENLPRPIFLSAGRIAPEKNLEAFLSLDLPGTKVVIGDGPAWAALRAKYPDAIWLGRIAHDQLAPYYDAADVFVFHSRTDTFGLVMLEAMACGCPVAAFPVTGPIDVVTPGVDGVLDADLRAACLAALKLDRRRVRDSALARNWKAIAQRWLALSVPISSQRSVPPHTSSVPLGL